MQTVKRFPLLAALAALALALFLLLSRPGTPSAAQGGALIPTLTPSPVPTATLTPTPNPTATAAAAYFTVEQAELVSLYPRGVEYVLKVRSSAGQIERARVSFWTNEGHATSQPLEWDAGRGAWVYFDRMFSPPWFQIHFRFRAMDSVGNFYETEEQVQEYADPTREWVRRENEQIVVLLFGARKSLADDLFASANAAITRLEDAFGFSLDYKPYVVVMPDAQSFQEWQEYAEEYLAGLTLSSMGYTIQTLQWGEQDLVYTTVPHELTHIFQGYIAEAWDIPAWFTEGHATYFETVQQYDYEARVRRVASHPDFPTLRRELSIDQPGPDGGNRWIYDLGYTFVKYWIETYGMESHRIFWQAQVTMDFHEALEFATGRSFEELENEWRRWIGAPGPAPTLWPTPTLMPFPTAPPMPTLPGG